MFLLLGEGCGCGDGPLHLNGETWGAKNSVHAADQADLQAEPSFGTRHALQTAVVRVRPYLSEYELAEGDPRRGIAKSLSCACSSGAAPITPGSAPCWRALLSRATHMRSGLATKRCWFGAKPVRRTRLARSASPAARDAARNGGECQMRLASVWASAPRAGSSAPVPPVWAVNSRARF
jgi:hypothetical protein